MFSRVWLLLLPALLVAQNPDPTATARKALDLLLGRDYSTLAQMFSPELAKALPESGLKGVGAQIESLGAPKSIGTPEARPVGANSVVVIPLKFAATDLAFQVSVDSTGKIAGFFLRRVSEAPAIPWEKPSYSKPETFREREVTVGSDQWKLPGTLTVPVGKGPFAGIVLVHGSGPNDRDETIGANKVFKDLAEGLASRGIAVLRYVKRTKEYGAKMAGVSITVKEETVDDAVRAAALLRAQPEIDPKRVYVLGHSLGGNVAPRIARDDGKLAGLVIFAGSVRPLEDLMVEQIDYLSPKDGQAFRAQAAKVKALEPGDEDAPAILNAPASYWLDLKGYDPTALAKKLAVPMLILQGERDYQVSMQDFALWKAALGSRKDVTFRSYPALNHLFMTGEGKSLPAEYQKPGHVAPEVIDEIAKFVK